MRNILASLLLASTLLSYPLLAVEEKTSPFHFKNRFEKAQIGDYVITQQDQTYSLLLIRDRIADTLVLEEIAIPVDQIDLKEIKWSEWVAAKAPGHTSWTLYEIDLPSGQLLECYSHSKRGWLVIDETQQFLSKLLTLSLEKVPNNKRRKIGPQPLNGEADHRSIWNPPLTIAGQKISKPQFDVWHSLWPDDNSPMAGCDIELYFSSHNSQFPFPYWIEIKGTHYTFKMRTIDTGSSLHSPLTGPIPHRPPFFVGAAKKQGDKLYLKIAKPFYYRSLNLFAIDLSSDSISTIPISFQIENESRTTEETELSIPLQQLQKLLINGHRYQWALVPEDDGHIYVESDEIFTWK